MSSVVEEITGHLASQVESALERGERYLAAKQFWLHEFSQEIPGLELTGDAPLTSASGRAAHTCRLERSILERLQAIGGAELPVILLAAYSTLLSRLSGREEMLVVTAIEGREAIDPAPLRLSPTWEASFSGFVQQIERKLRLVRDHTAAALDILADELPPSPPAAWRPVCEVGYLFRASAESSDAVHLVDQLGLHPALKPGLDLVVVATANGEGLTLQLVYRRSRFGQKFVGNLASYLESILRQVAEDSQLRLGAIRLGTQWQQQDASFTLAQDTFRF
jgi:non-ribosomal peptide synthetase component F